MKILLDTDSKLSVRHTHQTDAGLKLQGSKSQKQVGRRKVSNCISEKFFCKANEIILLLIPFYYIYEWPC